MALTQAHTNTKFTIFSILETKLSVIAKAFLYIPPPTATTGTSFLSETSASMPVSYVRWTLILFHPTSISLHLTFHCQDVNSKRGSYYGVGFIQTNLCKKSIEYALIWIKKFGNQTFFPPACYGSLFCLIMEIQRNCAKNSFLKKKKEKEKLKRVVNHYNFSYTMLLQFDSWKNKDCVIYQHQMIKSNINSH